MQSERINVNDFRVSTLFNGKIATVKHGKRTRYVNAWVGFDTETYANDQYGYIVMWTCALHYNGRMVTVWGRTADEAIHFFAGLSAALSLDENRRLVVYVHNYSYDYVFIRNFCIESWGVPAASLAVKTHRYIAMHYANGIEFKDSYILAQCSLEKWAHDLGAEVQKATGKWDYTKRRTPATPLTDDEIDYACADAEALALCVQLKAAQGGYGVGSVPLTATGFARDAARTAAFADGWRDVVHQLDMTFAQYDRCSRTFQGGITHGNRYEIARVHHGVVSYDFASSYPYVLCVEKFPMSKWVRARYSLQAIMQQSNDYAFMFDLVLIDAKVKSGVVMPPIPQSKCTHIDNGAKFDNGKLLSARMVCIPVNEIDLQIYLDAYDYSGLDFGLASDTGFAHGDVYTCTKDYLPRWFVDMVQRFFHDKTVKKGADQQQYMYAKGLLNSFYGMCAQRPVRPDIFENYDAPAGEEWQVQQRQDPKEQYSEYLGRYNYFLPYQWSMYVTSYARRNLMELGRCCRLWLYCDTDSVKGLEWDLTAVEDYNKRVLRKLKQRGIKPVEFDGRTYCMGIAEHDADYSEFITLGAKRYAYRDAKDGKLHITVAGVPKAGVEALQDDIYKFSRGLVFHDTGKLVPEYHTQQGITTADIDGCTVRVGSWVNLVAADYALDMTDTYDRLLDMPAEWLQDGLFDI